MFCKSIPVLNAGRGNGVGVMVGSKGVGLAVRLVVGEGGARVAVGEGVAVDVTVVRCGASVPGTAGEILQAAVPAMHRMVKNQNLMAAFFCLIARANRLEIIKRCNLPK